MTLRSEWVMQGGYTLVAALAIAGIVALGTLVIGFIKFQKYDILNLDSE